MVIEDCGRSRGETLVCIKVRTGVRKGGHRGFRAGESKTYFRGPEGRSANGTGRVRKGIVVFLTIVPYDIFSDSFIWSLLYLDFQTNPSFC